MFKLLIGIAVCVVVFLTLTIFFKVPDNFAATIALILAFGVTGILVMDRQP